MLMFPDSSSNGMKWKTTGMRGRDVEMVREANSSGKGGASQKECRHCPNHGSLLSDRANSQGLQSS